MPDFLVFGAWLPRLLGRPVIHDIHDLMPELYLENSGPGRTTRSSGSSSFRSARRPVSPPPCSPWKKASGTSCPREAFPGEDPRPHQPSRRAGVPPSAAPAAPGRERALGDGVSPAPSPGGWASTWPSRATTRLRADIPNLRFRIIGAGEEREALLRLRSELGLDDVVSMTEGYVPVDEIPALIADADVGIVPLRLSAGTEIMLPTKLLEYVQVGIPCVTPRTRTIGRYFDETMVRFYQGRKRGVLGRGGARRLPAARAARIHAAGRGRGNSLSALHVAHASEGVHGPRGPPSSARGCGGPGGAPAAASPSHEPEGSGDTRQRVPASGSSKEAIMQTLSSPHPRSRRGGVRRPSRRCGLPGRGRPPKARAPGHLALRPVRVAGSSARSATSTSARQHEPGHDVAVLHATWDEIEYFELALPHAEKEPKVAGVKAAATVATRRWPTWPGTFPRRARRPGSRANEGVSCDLCHSVTGVSGTCLSISTTSRNR